MSADHIMGTNETITITKIIIKTDGRHKNNKMKTDQKLFAQGNNGTQ